MLPVSAGKKFLFKKNRRQYKNQTFGKGYMRDNDSVRDNRLQNMNNILGIMAESQIIKTEKTTLNALLHYRKFFYQNQDVDLSRNNDFVVGNILYNQQLFKNGMRLQAFMNLGTDRKHKENFSILK
jgi:hypothetical protein